MSKEETTTEVKVEETEVKIENNFDDFKEEVLGLVNDCIRDLNEVVARCDERMEKAFQLFHDYPDRKTLIEKVHRSMRVGGVRISAYGKKSTHVTKLQCAFTITTPPKPGE